MPVAAIGSGNTDTRRCRVRANSRAARGGHRRVLQAAQASWLVPLWAYGCARVWRSPTSRCILRDVLYGRGATDIATLLQRAPIGAAVESRRATRGW